MKQPLGELFAAIWHNTTPEAVVSLNVFKKTNISFDLIAGQVALVIGSSKLMSLRAGGGVQLRIVVPIVMAPPLFYESSTGALAPKSL